MITLHSTEARTLYTPVQLRSISETVHLIDEADVQQDIQVDDDMITKYFPPWPRSSEGSVPRVPRMCERSMYANPSQDMAEIYSVICYQVCKKMYEFFNIKDPITLLDGCANIGAITLWFSKHFQQVTALENDTHEFRRLQHNLRLYQRDNVKTECVTLRHHSLFHDTKKTGQRWSCVFINPSWGGSSFRYLKKLHLAHEGEDVNVTIKRIFQRDIADMVIVHNPSNWFIDPIQSTPANHVFSICKNMKKAKRCRLSLFINPKYNIKRVEGLCRRFVKVISTEQVQNARQDESISLDRQKKEEQEDCEETNTEETVNQPVAQPSQPFQRFKFNRREQVQNTVNEPSIKKKESFIKEREQVQNTVNEPSIKKKEAFIKEREQAQHMVNEEAIEEAQKEKEPLIDEDYDSDSYNSASCSFEFETYDPFEELFRSSEQADTFSFSDDSFFQQHHAGVFTKIQQLQTLVANQNVSN